MNDKVARITSKKILEYCLRNNQRKIAVILHGGEPLIGGVEHLTMILSTVYEIFKKTGIELDFQIQSNGLLFTEEIGELFLKYKVHLGIRIDGRDHQMISIDEIIKEVLHPKN